MRGPSLTLPKLHRIVELLGKDWTPRMIAAAVGCCEDLVRKIATGKRHATHAARVVRKPRMYRKTASKWALTEGT